MFLLLLVLQSLTPHFIHKVFGKLQLVSAAWMAHSHGTNDAQKTMGIIALALFAGTSNGAFATLPPHAGFRGANVGRGALRDDDGGGDGGGDWRIIRTFGHKMVKL